MKKRIRPTIIFCSLGLLGISVGPVEAQEGQEDSWSNFTSRIAEVFGVDAKEAAAQGQAKAAIQRGEETESNVTPSHVFQATLDVLSEIEILRNEMAVDDYPNQAELQDGRAPVHAYAKTIEVLGKVARAQRKLGMIPVDPGQIPVKQITPADVMGSVQTILEEIRRTKSQLVIETPIDPAPFAGGKTPSLVYKNLGDASFLLDGLVGRSTTPSDVFGNVMHIHDDMGLIAAKLSASLEIDPPVVEGRKRPQEVAQQMLRATYKVIGLQNRLGMDASNVPNLTLVRITPAEVFEITNILLAEMTRIKLHLDINLPHEPRDVPRNKKPTDVFAQVLKLIRNLDLLSVAAAQEG